MSGRPTRFRWRYLPHLALGVLAALLLLPTPGPSPREVASRPLLRIPAITRQAPFLLLVAPAAPWVFACVSISFAYLPGELGGSQEGAVAFAGVLAAVSLGTGVLVQPLARRLDDRRRLLAGQLGLCLAVIGILVGLLALSSEVRWVLLLSAPILGGGYGCCLVSGLRETERLAAPDQLGATVAVFYALTYLGFAAPYALGGLAGLGLGTQGALAVAAASAAGCLVLLSVARSSLSESAGTWRA